MQCKGWVTYEQTVRRGVTAFLADLFMNKLPIHKYLEEEAQAMAQDSTSVKAHRGGEPSKAIDSLYRVERPVDAARAVLNDMLLFPL